MEQLTQNNTQKVNLNILLGVEKTLLDLKKKKGVEEIKKKRENEIIKDIKNLFSLKKEINDNTSVRNCFRLKKENKVAKDRIIAILEIVLIKQRGLL